MEKQSNAAIIPEGQRRCPICHGIMKTDRKEGIIIDVCGQHGIWLDKGELSKIVNHILERTNRQVRPYSIVADFPASKLTEDLWIALFD
jgi:Zn-finger nucleic acid-binding protein